MRNLHYRRLFAMALVFASVFTGINSVPAVSQSAGSNKKQFEREFKHENDLYERARMERERSADPATGEIPSNVYEQQRTFIEHLRSTNGRAAIQSSSIGFRSIGPGNIGGRTRAFAVDYSNPRVMIAGGVTGGMWRSIDAGETWARVSPSGDLLNVSCIAQHPTDPAVWYAGTGEVLSTTERRTTMLLRTISTGSGIYKSTDNGITWNRITPLISNEYNSLKTDLQGVWAVVPAAAGSGVEVFAACYGGIYAISGTSVTPVLIDTLKPSFNTEITCTPNRSVWYAGCGATDDGSAPSTYGVWRRDESGKWANITPTVFPKLARRFRIAVSPSNPSVVYVFTQTPSSYPNRFISFGSQLSLWRYTDDGKGTGKWESRKAWLDSTQLNTLAGYALTLTVHPENDSMVFIAGTDAYMSKSGFAVANDAVHLGGYPYIVAPGRLHPDIHHLGFSTTKPYLLYAAGDGGLSYTSEWNKEDGYWRTLNNGYNVTQAYHASQDHFDVRDSMVSVSLQDNSNYITTAPGSGRGWTHCGGGDGTCTAVMPGASLIFASSQYASVYAFTLSNGNIEYTGFDAPLAADSLSAQFVNTFFLLPRLTRNDTVLVMPVANRLFYFAPLFRAFEQASYRRLWMEAAQMGPLVSGGSRISALGRSRYEDATVLAGTTAGAVFSVSLQTLVPVVTQLPALPVKGFVSSLDQDEDGNIVVSLSNYNVRSVFMLAPGASAWKDISDNLEGGQDTLGWGPSVRSCRFYTHPLNGKRFVLAGTSGGLFAREILAADMTPWTWIAASTIGNAMVESIDIRHADGRIIVGTQGAGVYESVLIDDTNGVDTNLVQLLEFDDPYPNPVAEACFLRYRIPDAGQVRIRLFDALGGRVMTLADGMENAGAHVIELDRSQFGAISQGAYYVKMEYGSQAITKMLTLVRK